MAEQINRIHSFISENRQSLIISAVDEVEGFDDKTVVMQTSMGRITIKGSGFKIVKLSLETGDVCIEGKLNALEYSDSVRRKGEGFFAGIFR